MKIKSRLAYVFILFLVFNSSNSYAWDSFGHMVVAYLAYQKLNPDVQQRANQLLKLNPSYSKWSGWIPEGMSAENSQMMIFMFAATWPDEIKGIPHQAPPINPETGQQYEADGSDGGDRADGSPNASANEGYSDNSMHKYWHFVDTPFSTDGTALPPIPVPNAEGRIALFRNVLASDSSDSLKSYDLTWLLHLVGDVHQPLHCATRVSSVSPNGDAGGNDVKLNGNPNELHMFWDNVIGVDKSPATIVNQVVAVAKTLPDPDPIQAADTSESDWVSESFRIATEDVYTSPIGPGNGPFTLSSDYKIMAKKIAGERMALAGARLANLLNTNLK